MPILAQALHAWGLISDPSEMDASLISSDRKHATLWPGGRSVSIDELTEVHRTIYCSVAEATCVLGVSTKEVQAVAKKPEGLQMLSQGCSYFYGCSVMCEDVPSAAGELKDAERPRLLLLQGMGKAYVIGNYPGACFTLAYYIQKFCRLQLLVGTHALVAVDKAIWTHANEQSYLPDFEPGVEWPAVKGGVQRSFVVRPLEEPTGCDSEERKLRVAMANCHREICKKGFGELIWNHCSALLGEAMLVTPGDCLWDDIAPADFLLNSRNVTANVLHSAIYAATSAKAVIHTHAPGIEAVSCIKGGLIAPRGSQLAGRVAYHPWQGFSDDDSECKVIGEALRKIPDCAALICENHGAFTWGNSLDEALERHIALEEACWEQLRKAEGTHYSSWVSSGHNYRHMGA